MKQDDVVLPWTVLIRIFNNDIKLMFPICFEPSYVPLSITFPQFTPTADCSYSAMTLHPNPNATLFSKLWNSFQVNDCALRALFEIERSPMIMIAIASIWLYLQNPFLWSHLFHHPKCEEIDKAGKLQKTTNLQQLQICLLGWKISIQNKSWQMFHSYMS